MGTNGMAILIKSFGWVLSLIPDTALQIFCGMCAWVWCRIMPRRRATAERNLRHAFPNEPDEWYRRTIATSFSRTIEMALFALVSPFWKKEKLISRIGMSQECWEMIRAWEKSPKAKIFLLPHVCLVEGVAHSPLIIANKGHDIGIIASIFRPLNQASLDDWIQKSRERSGSRLLSRKKGFNEARRILKNKGGVAVLFDQRAGGTGTLLMCLGRISSVTELPSLLAREQETDVCLTVCERTGFLRCCMHLEKIPPGDQPEDVTIWGNHAFDQYILRNKDRAEDWLWVHDRWRTHFTPSQRLNLNQKRSLLDRQSHLLQWDHLPRETKFCVRMPDERDNFLAAIIFVTALTRGRPDIKLALAGPSYGEVLLSHSRLPFTYHVVTGNKLRQPSENQQIKKFHPDTVIVLAPGHSVARQCRSWGCPQTIGIRHMPGSQFLDHALPVSGHELDHVPQFGDLPIYAGLAILMGLDRENFRWNAPLTDPLCPPHHKDQILAVFHHTDAEAIVREAVQSSELPLLFECLVEPVEDCRMQSGRVIDFLNRPGFLSAILICDDPFWVLWGRGHGLPTIWITPDPDSALGTSLSRDKGCAPLKCLEFTHPVPEKSLVNDISRTLKGWCAPDQTGREL